MGHALNDRNKESGVMQLKVFNVREQYDFMNPIKYGLDYPVVE